MKALRYFCLVASLGLLAHWHGIRPLAADDTSPGNSALSDLATSAGVDLDGDPLPPGAIARLGTKHFHPGRSPKAIFFLPDGKTLAQITGDGWVQHWEIATGKLLREHRFSEQGVQVAANPGPTARMLAIGNASVDEQQRKWTNIVQVVSKLSGQEQAKVELKDRIVERLALSADASTIAYPNQAGAVCVVDVASQQQVASQGLGQRRVYSLAFSPDGKTLAVGTEGKIHLWNWNSDAAPASINIEVERLYGPQPIDHLAFSPDGKSLAIKSGRNFLLVGADKGQTLRSFQLPAGVAGSGTFAFSPDGKFLAASVGGDPGYGVVLWDVGSGKQVHWLDGMYRVALELTFSPDGKRLAGCSYWDNSMCVWEVETGKQLGLNLPTHQQPPAFLRFLDDDKRLASAGDDNALRLWNLSDQHQVRMMQHERDEKSGHEIWIRSMDVSPDGKYIVSSSMDDTVRLWEAATGREIYRLPGHGGTGGLRAVRFTPDGKQFASWGDDMRVHLWDVATGKATQDYRLQPQGIKLPAEEDVGHEPFDNSPREGFFSPDAKTLFLVWDGIRRFSVQDGKELPAIPLQENALMGARVSPNNQWMLSSGYGEYTQIQLADGDQGPIRLKNYPLKLIQLADNKVIANIEMPGLSGGPVAISPDSKLAAVASEANENGLEFRRLPSLDRVQKIELPSRPRAIEFSHSGKLLAVSLADCTVLVLNLEELLAPTKP